MMNAHFSAAVPNLRIMETDIDRLAWDHELFTHLPEIVDGHLIIPDRPGWGTEPNEEGLRAHPPKNKGRVAELRAEEVGPFAPPYPLHARALTGMTDPLNWHAAPHDKYRGERWPR